MVMLHVRAGRGYAAQRRAAALISRLLHSTAAQGVYDAVEVLSVMGPEKTANPRPRIMREMVLGRARRQAHLDKIHAGRWPANGAFPWHSDG